MELNLDHLTHAQLSEETGGWIMAVVPVRGKESEALLKRVIYRELEREKIG